MYSAPGKVLSVKDCAGPLTVAFDGKAPQPIFSGTVLNGPFQTLQFFNASAAAVTVNFFTGNNAVAFAPASNAQSNARSFFFGNLGIKTGSAANTFPGAPACDAGGFLQITDAMYLLVSGTRNGCRRQVLLISVDANAAFPLNVLDPNSGAGGEYACLTLQKGSQVELLTDGDVIFSGAGGTVGATIGQIFLSNV